MHLVFSVACLCECFFLDFVNSWFPNLFSFIDRKELKINLEKALSLPLSLYDPLNLGYKPELGGQE